MNKLDKKSGESVEAWKKHVNAYHKKWREKNKDNVRAAEKRYREKNKELLQTKRKKAYIEHHEEKIEKSRAWRERNKDKVREYTRSYEKRNPGRKNPKSERERERVNSYNRKRYAQNLEAERQRSKEKAAKWKAQGFCHNCPTPRMWNSNSYCEKHWFSAVATSRLGTGGKTIERGEALKAKLEAQNYSCVYTGIKLVPGVNAALDHIMPASRFPKKRGNIENVQWVDEVVNKMKTDRTENEFFSMCKKIVEHHRK